MEFCLQLDIILLISYTDPCLKVIESKLFKNEMTLDRLMKL